ncbi:CPBP family intramembrane glutamic endopeptidase [Dermacoccus nishinomiyaensis]|uniref:CPBP family intramembrane glutamic endopeptidase n=1 Tax=Dermacoccus nishinomiyaensis TaxID=1274 RepID=UPI0013F46B7F|nr:type II CAAX endopeptidase family protein [Dermacoccus nishinomiyaensis]NHC32206.1 CPBP family intramembrane metalloprotease [Dermacoccus nishinomiyaensis]
MARIDWRVAQWWRPFATLGVAFGATIVMMIALGVVALAWEGLGLPAASESLEDGGNPADLMAMLGPLAALVPIVVLASWWGAGRRGSIHSVFGRFRWGLLGRAARVVVPIYALVILVPPLLFGRDELTVPPLTASLVASYVIILVLTPLQCAGEEYLFRGMPQQALGTWLKSPLWGISLPVPLFMLGHGYDWVGQIDIACFALCMGALVWRSGGLELAILVHAANNTMSFLLAPLTPNSLEQGAVNPAALLFSLPLIFGITAWLWWWVGKQYGVNWKTPVRRLPGPQHEQVGRWL